MADPQTTPLVTDGKGKVIKKLKVDVNWGKQNPFAVVGYIACSLMILTTFVSCNSGSSYKVSDATDYVNPYYYFSVLGALTSNKARQFNAETVTPLNDDLAVKGGFREIGGVPTGVYGDTESTTTKKKKGNSKRTQVATNLVPDDFETQTSREK